MSLFALRFSVLHTFLLGFLSLVLSLLTELSKTS